MTVPVAPGMQDVEDAAPLVTVVMSFLDGERYIAAAIDSVLAQTLERWELLLVDDGSRDGSPAIAAEYASREPGRIRVLQHAGGGNRGIAASRKLGMGAARGRYLAFLDADDLYEPQRLERHVRELEDDPGLGVVLSADLYWQSWQSDPQTPSCRADLVIQPAVEPGRRIEPPAFIAATLMTAGAPMPAICSITFRKAAFDAIDGAPDEFRGLYEDQVLLCKLLLRYPVLALDEPLARYRQHTESVTRANAPLEQVPGSAANLARLQFLRWLQGHLGEHGVELPELQDWVSSQIDGLRRGAAGLPGGQKSRLRSGARRTAVTLLPQSALRAIERSSHRLDAWRVRRRVMQRIDQIDSTPAGRDRAIRVYWDRRVNDTRLSGHPPGTTGFYAALDDYRLRKNEYLPRVVDFAAWRGRDVLEVGCGPGLDLVRFARGGARVTGVDVSPVALDLARGCCQATAVPVTLIEADGARLPLADASFDLVYCHGVLSFASDPLGVIAEADRVLRPGGQAIFMVYNRRSWMNLVLRIPGLPVGQGHADAPGFRAYAAPEFTRLLALFPDHQLVFERYDPANVRLLPKRWLQPFGWHLLAFCRKQR